MADPMTLALVGAGAGAIMSPRDPLRGAVIGAIGGYAGGSALGAGGAASGQGLAAGMPTVTTAAGDVSLASAYTGPAAQVAARGATIAPITNAVAVPASEAAITGAVQPAYAGVGAPGNVVSGGSLLSSAAGTTQDKSINALKMAQQIGGRQQPTAASPMQMKKPGGGQVNLAEPIAGLLGGYGPMDIRKRRNMNLLG